MKYLMTWVMASQFDEIHFLFFGKLCKFAGRFNKKESYPPVLKLRIYSPLSVGQFSRLCVSNCFLSFIH